MNEQVKTYVAGKASQNVLFVLKGFSVESLGWNMLLSKKRLTTRLCEYFN